MEVKWRACTGKKRTKTRAGPNAESIFEALEAGGKDEPATLAADADAGFGASHILRVDD